MEQIPATEQAASAVFFGDVKLCGAEETPLLSGQVADYCRAHALRCCNFEGPAFHERPVTYKKAGPAELQGRSAVRRVLESGFNLISLANNHIMDYGEAGLAATLAGFSDVPTLGAGETAPLAYRPYVTTVNGVKLGFLALGECQYGACTGFDGGAGYAWVGQAAVYDNVRMLRAECDHVIVLCHAGLEGYDQPLPEWRAVYRRFIDAGASAVIAHHPHVPQGWEPYKSGVVFFSLGNAAWEPEGEFAERRALLASVTFPKVGRPRFEARPIRFDHGVIDFFEDEAYLAHIRGMNAVLRDDAAYRREVEAMCADFYGRAGVSDFFTITGSLPGGDWQRVKNAAKLVLRKPALNEPLLLSMLENESYRWAVAAALRKRTGRAGRTDVERA